MNVEVRAFLESDIPAVRALWAASDGLGHGPGDDPAAIARFLRRNPGISTVGLAGEHVVAAALCGHDGRRGFLYRLAVADAVRRRGVARAVVERSLAALVAEGIPRCMLFVLAENTGAARFWSALGASRRDELDLLSIDLAR